MKNVKKKGTTIKKAIVDTQNEDPTITYEDVYPREYTHTIKWNLDSSEDLNLNKLNAT
jgi:hypothetical protein